MLTGERTQKEEEQPLYLNQLILNQERVSGEQEVSRF